MSEFLKLTQITETVNEITVIFKEKLSYCTAYAADEGMEMHRYSEMLREDIRETVASGQYTTLNQMLEAARKRELFLNSKVKKKAVEQTGTGNNYLKAPAKKFQSGDSKFTEKEGTRCPKCGKGHTGECRQNQQNCFKCGKTGHMSRDCQANSSVCFKCNQPRQRIAECPEGAAGGRAVWQPPLMITNGEEGKKQAALKARCRAFQMIVEDDKVNDRT